MAYLIYAIDRADQNDVREKLGNDHHNYLKNMG